MDAIARCKRCIRILEVCLTSGAGASYVRFNRGGLAVAEPEAHKLLHPRVPIGARSNLTIPPLVRNSRHRTSRKDKRGDHAATKQARTQSHVITYPIAEHYQQSSAWMLITPPPIQSCRSERAHSGASKAKKKKEKVFRGDSYTGALVFELKRVPRKLCSRHRRVGLSRSISPPHHRTQ